MPHARIVLFMVPLLRLEITEQQKAERQGDQPTDTRMGKIK